MKLLAAFLALAAAACVSAPATVAAPARDLPAFNQLGSPDCSARYSGSDSLVLHVDLAAGGVLHVEVASPSATEHTDRSLAPGIHTLTYRTPLDALQSLSVTLSTGSGTVDCGVSPG
jgi:hypothetical protein